jgi:WhiB family redox-sensing transcriptional regulator
VNNPEREASSNNPEQINVAEIIRGLGMVAVQLGILDSVVGAFGPEDDPAVMASRQQVMGGLMLLGEEQLVGFFNNGGFGRLKLGEQSPDQAGTGPALYLVYSAPEEVDERSRAADRVPEQLAAEPGLDPRVLEEVVSPEETEHVGASLQEVVLTPDDAQGEELRGWRADDRWGTVWYYPSDLLPAILRHNSKPYTAEDWDIIEHDEIPISEREGSWHDAAICAQVDTELFFPEKGGSDKIPKRICAQCPVSAECLAYALRYDMSGVWGGTSGAERRRLKKRSV